MTDYHLEAITKSQVTKLSNELLKESSNIRCELFSNLNFYSNPPEIFAQRVNEVYHQENLGEVLSELLSIMNDFILYIKSQEKEFLSDKVEFEDYPENWLYFIFTINILKDLEKVYDRIFTIFKREQFRLLEDYGLCISDPSQPFLSSSGAELREKIIDVLSTYLLEFDALFKGENVNRFASCCL
ncbi:hypothetical protein [Geminocystis herdmanii]|uniref:hypothetical protein n=1 Tax=Geminocystis herdmanii TaxID=669359 RepID=UPI0003498A93|nr:hypothetical protein [Geminocystis herdmanii]